VVVMYFMTTHLIEKIPIPTMYMKYTV
jgi:hypothetical protein